MKSRVLNLKPGGADIAAAAASSGTMDRSPAAKVVAHFRGFGFVLLYPDGQQHYVTGELPTRLISVSTQVKPVVARLASKIPSAQLRDFKHSR